jgi:hypothetical protein
MTSNGIRQAAKSRTARIVNKRLVSLNGACVSEQAGVDKRRHTNGAHHNDGQQAMLVAEFVRAQSVTLCLTF